MYSIKPFFFLHFFARAWMVCCFFLSEAIFDFLFCRPLQNMQQEIYTVYRNPVHSCFFYQLQKDDIYITIFPKVNVFSKLRNLSDEHQPTSLKWALIWGKQLESNVCFADKLFQSEWPAWHRSSAREKWAIRSAKKMGNLSKVRSLREEGIILCIAIRMFWPSNELRENRLPI